MNILLDVKFSQKEKLNMDSQQSKRQICDAHTIRNARWSQEYCMAKFNYTIRGYSRAAFRTGFYIPELGIMLDAGPQCFNCPKEIFITHCHGDHIAELPFTFFGYNASSENENGEKEYDVPNLYGPKGSHKFVHRYLESTFQMNMMAEIQDVNSYYNYKEVVEEDILNLNIKNNEIVVNVIKCDHSVPTVSYLFSTVKKKLKQEYYNIADNSAKIVALKKQGVEITEPVEKQLFAYVCDCSIKTVERYEGKLATYPYVIIECTFILDDELENAKETKHIHWKQLEKFVAKYPDTIWILIHFSLRYKDSEIQEFFKEYLEKYQNLHIWASSLSSKNTTPPLFI